MKLGACNYCGGIHENKCPLVKSFEYYPDGTIKRVEFYSQTDYGPMTPDNLKTLRRENP